MIGRVLLSTLVAAAALAGIVVRPTGEVSGPVVVVRVTPAAASFGGAATEGDDDVAMALAAASIAPPDRHRVLEEMSYTAARLEARLSPLAEDFGDESADPVEDFRAYMATHLPTFTAARALVSGTHRGGGVVVRLAESCADAAPGPDEVCAPLWTDEPSTPLLARARFFAWAAARAAVVDLGTPDRAAAFADALRPRVSASGSPLGLVLTPGDLALRPIVERAELEETARRLGRAMAANEIEDEQRLEAFARSAPRGRALPWLSLSASEVLVVPRLSAVGRGADMTREIEAAAHATGGAVRWRHRPETTR